MSPVGALRFNVPSLNPSHGLQPHITWERHRDSLARYVAIGNTQGNNWLVVLTILKNISQWEGLSHILWKIKNVPNHQPDNHIQ
jgi:hypothetical protein